MSVSGYINAGPTEASEEYVIEIFECISKQKKWIVDGAVTFEVKLIYSHVS